MEKMKYVQPEIEVLTIKIDQGFAVTGGNGQDDSPFQDADKLIPPGLIPMNF